MKSVLKKNEKSVKILLEGKGSLRGGKKLRKKEVTIWQ